MTPLSVVRVAIFLAVALLLVLRPHPFTGSGKPIPVHTFIAGTGSPIPTTATGAVDVFGRQIRYPGAALPAGSFVVAP